VFVNRCVDFGMKEQRPAGGRLCYRVQAARWPLVYVFAQDSCFWRFALGNQRAWKICKIMDLAIAPGLQSSGLNDSVARDSGKE